MGPTRIVGTVAHSEDPQSALADRSAVIFDWNGAEPKWVATELPLAPNAIGARAFAFCLARETRGSLISCTVAHGFHNGLIVCLVMALSS